MVDNSNKPTEVQLIDLTVSEHQLELNSIMDNAQRLMWDSVGVPKKYFENDGSNINAIRQKV